MKVLFAVSNENITTSVISKYQQKYKEIVTSKNVYYFNAIIKELQIDKNYDVIVIGEDLEPISNNNYDEIDKFIIEKLDSISDEASKSTGEDIPIIFLCSDRRTKSDGILRKFFSMGIYNALVGVDRSLDKVCSLMNKPRNKKEAKKYYQIEDDVTISYEPSNDELVSEDQLRAIQSYYKKIGNDEKKCVQAFEHLSKQYNDAQLRLIVSTLPIEVKAVLETSSPIYQTLMEKGTVLSDGTFSPYKKTNDNKPKDIDFFEKDLGTTSKLTSPVVIPSNINVSNENTNSTMKSSQYNTPSYNTNSQNFNNYQSNNNYQNQQNYSQYNTMQGQYRNQPQNSNINNTQFSPYQSRYGSIAPYNPYQQNNRNNNNNNYNNSYNNGYNNNYSNTNNYGVTSNYGQYQSRPIQNNYNARTIENTQGNMSNYGSMKNTLTAPTTQTTQKVENVENNQKTNINNNEISSEIKEQNKLEQNEVTPIKEIAEGPTNNETSEVVAPIKKRRGRPRKNPLPDTETVKVQEEPLEGTIVKRRRGRPRKVVDTNQSVQQPISAPKKETVPSIKDTYNANTQNIQNTSNVSNATNQNISNNLSKVNTQNVPNENTLAHEDTSVQPVKNNFDLFNLNIDTPDTPNIPQNKLTNQNITNYTNNANTINTINTTNDNITDNTINTNSKPSNMNFNNNTSSSDNLSDDKYDFLRDDYDKIIKQEESDATSENENNYLNTEETKAPSIESTNIANDIFNENGYAEDESLLNQNKNDSNFGDNFVVAGNGKIVSFVGTTKNGTSFIINNIAEMLAEEGIKVAVVDLTANRNSYYMFTNDEPSKIKIASNSLKKLSNEVVEGLKIRNNLSLFTAIPYENIENTIDPKKILDTASKNFDIVMLDCDLKTESIYFQQSDEIYIVQSMDTFTIQPLTKFLCNNIGVFDFSKIHVIINKYIKLKKLDYKMILVGMSTYNDPIMSMQRNLFDANKVSCNLIPFDVQTYSAYLEAIAMCKINIDDYSSQVKESLDELKERVFPLVDSEKRVEQRAKNKKNEMKRQSLNENPYSNAYGNNNSYQSISQNNYQNGMNYSNNNNAFYSNNSYRNSNNQNNQNLNKGNVENNDMNSAFSTEVNNTLNKMRNNKF